MKTTNTNGVIAKAAETQAAIINGEKKPKNPMDALLKNEETIKVLQNALKENAGAYAAAILDLYNSDTTLQACNPKQVFGECLKAVSLKLPINKQLGFAYVVPYKDKTGRSIPQFQIGYKGLLQLCQRTGMYKHINADVIYEGELKSRDKLTGELDITGERVSDKVIGYFAYIETLNGFRHSIYMTVDEIVKHATRFSKSYPKSNSVWKTDFDAMAIKTVLRLLLSKYGYMSVEMINAMTAEETPANTPDNIDNRDMVDTDAIITDVTEKTAESNADITPEKEQPENTHVNAPINAPKEEEYKDEPYPFDDVEMGNK